MSLIFLREKKIPLTESGHPLLEEFFSPNGSYCSSAKGVSSSFISSMTFTSVTVSFSMAL